MLWVSCTPGMGGMAMLSCPPAPQRGVWCPSPSPWQEENWDLQDTGHWSSLATCPCVTPVASRADLAPESRQGPVGMGLGHQPQIQPRIRPLLLDPCGRREETEARMKQLAVAATTCPLPVCRCRDRDGGSF